MNLYLVRHGEAARKDQGGERPLTEAGREGVRRVGAFLGRGRVVSVAEIRHSGKLRARQTAEIIAESSGLAAPIRAAPNLEPLAEVSGLVAALGGESEDLMLVGHLPHLSRLASALVGAAPDLEAFEFEAGAVLCLRRSGGGSRSGLGDVWVVAWMVVPSLLGS